MIIDYHIIIILNFSAYYFIYFTAICNQERITFVVVVDVVLIQYKKIENNYSF